jgi:hypothetical protein
MTLVSEVRAGVNEDDTTTVEPYCYLILQKNVFIIESRSKSIMVGNSFFGVPLVSNFLPRRTCEDGTA